MTKSLTTLLPMCCAALPISAAYAQEAPNTGTLGTQQSERASDSVEALRQQLAAQKAISAQLRARVDALERQLAAGKPGSGPVVLGLDANAAKPPVESDVANTAIEEALVGKGLVLLPTGTFRFTPSATWSHDGSGQDT
jgi:hypothetical protein